MFKNHFVSILSRVDDRFSLYLWCYLVRPAELTVNLLQQSNVAPKVSTYAHVHGQHNYMKRPFAPLGCAVMASNPRTVNSGTFTRTPVMAMEHDRCFNIYIVKTRATRISDTVFVKHQYITNPQVTTKTLVIKAVLDLTRCHKCIKRNGLTWWQDGRCAPKVQQVIHKDSHCKIRIGKGKRAMNQPLKSLQCPPSCTTTKGGQETIHSSKPTSKGDDRYHRGWLSSHCNAYANCWRRDATTVETQTTHHEAILHYPGRCQRQIKPLYNTRLGGAII